MENQNKHTPDEESWFDNLLTTPEVDSKLGPDEHAVSASGLSDISDMELEKIIQETMSSDWLDEETLEESELFVDPEPVPEAMPSPFQDEYESELDLEQAFPGEFASEEDAEEDYPEAPEQEDYDVFEEEALPEGPVRKVRPRKKKGYGLFGLPHLASLVIWAVIVVSIGVSIGRLIWVCAADVLAFGRQEQLVTLTILQTDDMDDITEKLHKAGLVKYPDLFLFYAKLTNAKDDIIPGTYTLNTLFDYNALVNEMSSRTTSREEVSVMIPEGYTCAQIFALLEEKGVCSAAELEDCAQNGELNDYWFLNGVVRDGKYCLEGYLFPDTYKFYTNSSPEEALHKMLNGFNNRFSDDMIAHIDALNQRLANMMSANGYGQDYISANRMDIRDIVIIASMIEKESSGNAEGYTISSVIYNRLANASVYPFLDIDATIVYALGGKTGLTNEDKKVDSPYNTYTNPGLPPGPISNPGLHSLYAALDPDETPYYFYALNPATGAHHFSNTLEEHKAFLDSIRE